MNDYRQMLNDRLAESLDPEMQARYKKRRSDAIAAQDANYQGPEAIDALGEGQRVRALQAGLTKAANKFGSVGGDGGTKSDIDSTLHQMGEADEGVFKRKQAAFGDALKSEGAASDALNTMGDRSAKLAGTLDTADRTGVEREREDAKYGREQGVQAEEDDANSAISRSYQELASKMTGGKDFSGVPASRLKSIQSAHEKLYGIDEARKSRLEASKALAGQRFDAADERRLIREERAAAAAAAAQEKKDANDSLLVVPGYDRNPTVGVKPESAEKMRTAAASAENFQKSLEELITLQKEYGDYETGPIGARMQALSSGLQLQAKELENLGVLSGPDLNILRTQIPDVGNTVVSRNGNTEATLANALKTYKERSAANMAARGYSKHGGEGAFPRTVRNAKTGQTAQVSNASELAEAKAEGFE